MTRLVDCDAQLKESCRSTGTNPLMRMGGAILALLQYTHQTNSCFPGIRLFGITRLIRQLFRGPESQIDENAPECDSWLSRRQLCAHVDGGVSRCSTLLMLPFATDDPCLSRIHAHIGECNHVARSSVMSAPATHATYTSICCLRNSFGRSWS